jgi:hypothetical protein
LLLLKWSLPPVEPSLLRTAAAAQASNSCGSRSLNKSISNVCGLQLRSPPRMTIRPPSLLPLPLPPPPLLPLPLPPPPLLPLLLLLLVLVMMSITSDSSSN